MQHLNVLLVQHNIVWEDAKANLTQLDGILEHSEPTDLVVLPEMFATGFTMNPEEQACSMDSEAVRWLREKSATRAICGSLAVKENGHFVNRFLWAEGGEIRGQYDKRHLFAYGGEDKHYHSGHAKTDITFGGWNVAPFVCYDLRFPVWCRNPGHADVMVFVANWPEVRIAAWEKLLQARAIENQCYVIGVNRTGIDGTGKQYNGKSMVVDFAGNILLQLNDREITGKATLDRSALLEFREKFPFLNDRDSFTIQL